MLSGLNNLDSRFRALPLFLLTTSVCVVLISWYFGAVKMARVSQATLRSGAKMPMLGLGTYGLKGSEGKTAVMSAIDAGYRHIDCADDYENEAEVGDAIKTRMEEGKVKREDIFITSKLWCSFFAPDRVREGFDKSLKNLNLKYLDLYLLHWPFAMRDSSESEQNSTDLNSRMDDAVDYVDTWKELIKLQKAGLARAIGVSNFNEFQLRRLSSETSHPPDVNQFEYHPYLQQHDLVKFCQSQGIVVTAYSSLGSSEVPEIQNQLLNEPSLQAIAKKHGKSVSQILLRYPVENNIVVIPKSKTPSRIESNSQIFDFTLDSDDMRQIMDLNKNWRSMDVDGWASKEHKYYPFKKDYSE